VAKQGRRTLEVTLTLGVELVARLNAVALLRNQSRDAIATAALQDAVKGLVMWERGKPSQRSEGKDRPTEASDINPNDQEEAPESRAGVL
jgi:hypothetical protein